MNRSAHWALNLKRFLWVWLTLLLCLWMAWHLLAQANFLYPLWHNYAGIGENISQYGPLNWYKKEFHLTDDATRFALFKGIIDAIHRHGQGLRELAYMTSKGMQPLLRQPEIVHLQDVANLIDYVNRAALMLLLAWLIVSALIWQQIRHSQLAFIQSKSSLVNIVIGLGSALTALLLIGAKAVFYQLHIWIFPDNHQWFFYYQESLMSTMMKAPDLFAWIAASLLIAALALFALIQFLFNRITHRENRYATA